MLWRLPRALACLVCATVVTGAITPSNSTTARPPFQGTLPLRATDPGQSQIASLVPLTREASTRGFIEGNLFNTNSSTVTSLSAGEIAYISCNPADYVGFMGPDALFQSAFNSGNTTAVILYSTASAYCDYQQNMTQDMLQQFPILSMTNTQESASLLGQITNLPAHMKFFVKVVGRDNSSNSDGGSSGPATNPLGPSPSTAVAMIILYSITGIITALFLVIIVTGAIRAHRHPERYGPRDVLGRPRQSRARGLGRAILDTIPIVKFGEKDQEPTKPTDVELASVGETRDVNATHDTEQQTNPSDTAANEPTNRSADSVIPQTAATAGAGAAAAAATEHQEGIAPAQPAAASTKDNSSQDENLGCSICTEDFEKGQDLRVLPCDHKFHPECVDPWLLNVSGTCPLCRVDLRPVESHDSSPDHDPDAPNSLPPAESETVHRRRTALLDLIYFRTRPNATPEERIHALRRLREQRRANERPEQSDHAENDRRSRRISTRLSGVFSGRARRERSPTQQQQGENTSNVPALPTPSSSSSSSSSSPAPPSGDASSSHQRT